MQAKERFSRVGGECDEMLFFVYLGLDKLKNP